MKPLSQVERVELSDRRMIKTAIRLIVQQGISGTKLTEVGLRSGYSRGLAAMRFGTKAGLLRRVARHVLSGWLARVRQATGEKSGLEAISAAIDAQCRWMVDEPTEMRALYVIFFHSIDPDAEYHLNVARTLAAQRADLARWILEARSRGDIDAEVDPAEESEQILSAMLGIVYQSMMDRTLPMERMHSKLESDLKVRLTRTGSASVKRAVRS